MLNRHQPRYSLKVCPEKLQPESLPLRAGRKSAPSKKRIKKQVFAYKPDRVGDILSKTENK
jgi:hypothetical protein